MTQIGRRLFLLSIVVLVSACDRTYNQYAGTPGNPIAPAIPTPTPTPTPAAGDLVEYRVDGDVPTVTVRLTNSLDGITQIAAVLPFSQRVTFASAGNVFLSLEARSTGTGFLHAAIFVNGVIWREAASTGFSPVVTVSGTFRR